MTRESKSAVPSSSTSTGTFPERIELRRDRIRFPGIVDLELVFDLLLREHDADLARERAGERADEFHAADSTRSAKAS